MEENHMALKEILTALGLPAEATEEQALQALTGLQEQLTASRNRAQTPDLDKFVPRADYDAAIARSANAEAALVQQTEQQREAAINAAIEAALSAGKITPATRDYHIAQCRTDGGLERFAAFVAAAPEIAGPSGLPATPGRTEATAGTLTEAERATCRMLSISPKEYLEAKAAQATTDAEKAAIRAL